ncbi:fimbrial protein [Stenotrophomonas sp. AR026]|uniref:fimbrial protein n=1 Tax=Stenotrophomonas sp. AR026 TaxID=3398462 RepID=UPI003BAE1923
MKWLIEGLITDRRATTLLALLALGVCGKASANCYVYKESDTIAASATLTVNGVALGRAVSPWLQATRDTDYFAACTLGSSFTEARITGVQTPVGTYTEGGEVYGVYETGILGLGMVFAMRDEDNSLYPRYIPIRSTETKVAFSDWFNPDVRIRYIRTGDIPQGTFGTNDFRFAAGSITNGTPPVPAVFNIKGVTLTTRHRPLCRPEATHVRMASIPVTDFDGQYSGSRSRPFQVFLDCEAGVGNVKYVLEQTDLSPVVDRERGIVAVSGGATGVGLQMLEQSNGRPIPLDDVRDFGNSPRAGRISKQFFARYVQTAEKAEDVVLGQANAAIRIAMEYP